MYHEPGINKYITHFLSYCHKNPSLIDVSEGRACSPSSSSAGTNEFHGNSVCLIRCAANTRTLGRISLWGSLSEHLAASANNTRE